VGHVTWVNSLDPRLTRVRAEFDLATLLFERLVQLDSTGAPAPMLASRWELSNRSVTFRIRDRATFHDGVPVRAADVVRSFSPPPADSVGRRQLRALLLRIEGGRAFLDSGALAVRGLSTLGDSAVVVRFLASITPTITEFTRPALVVVGASSTADHPIGSGPWRYVRRALSDSAHVLTRVSTVAGMPDTLLFRAVALGAVGRAISERQVDCAPLLVSPTARRLLATRTDIAVRENGPTAASLVMVSPHGTRWHSVAARRGLALAIDRNAFLRVAAIRSAITTSGLLRPNGLTVQTAASPLPHDPQQGRALLDSAGIRVGDTVRVLVSAGSPTDTALGLAGLVGASLRGVGRVPQFVLSRNALADLASGRGDVFPGTYSQTNTVDDPAFDLAVPGSASLREMVLPLMRNADAITTRVQSAPSDRMFRRALRALDSAIVDQQPAIPLWFARPVSAHHPAVEGCTVSGAALHRHLDLRRVE
jgi:ABC-type transport system substrate-binding protein